MAKNPVTVQKLKIKNTTDSREIRIGQMMLNTLLDQLKLCSATSSLQKYICQPILFLQNLLPDTQAKEKKGIFWTRTNKASTKKNLLNSRNCWHSNFPFWSRLDLTEI